MKKIYLSVILLGVSAAAMAQKAPRTMTSNDLIPTAPKQTAKLPENKAVGVQLWTDNFNDPTTWVIDNSGQSGPNFGWNINNTSQGWWSTAGTGMSTTGTSGGNNAELANGDAIAATQALNVVYTMTTAAPIDIVDLGGTNSVTLSFKQYGARFNDLQEIQISEDGTTFVTVGDNLDKEVLSQAGGAAYPNPDTKMINLATVLSANPTQVWIRFRWTTNFPGSATNPNVWIAYGWYIDDVTLTTNADYDLAVTSTYWGTEFLPYYQIPLAQVAPIEFTANVFNGGVAPMTNTSLNVNVNTGLWTGSSTPVSVSPLASDSLVVSTLFTPGNTTPTTYTAVRTLTSADVDDVPTNNAMPNLVFSTTNHVYARDNNVPSGSTTNGTDGFEVGNLFDIWSNATLKAINVRFLGGANGTAVGTEVYAKIYSIDAAGEFQYEGESDFIILTAGNLNTNFVMPLLTPVDLLAGNTYLAVVGSAGGGLRVSNGGTSAPQTSFFQDLSDGTWYYQTNTPIVRLNFDPVVSLTETSAEVAISNVYPNPSTGETSIDYTLANAVVVNLNVTDLTGKVIYTINEGTVAEGTHAVSFDAANFANGVYYVTLTAGESVVTQKFIKK
jgi:hypothetical protein